MSPHQVDDVTIYINHINHSVETCPVLDTGNEIQRIYIVSLFFHIKDLKNPSLFRLPYPIKGKGETNK